MRNKKRKGWRLPQINWKKKEKETAGNGKKKSRNLQIKITACFFSAIFCCMIFYLWKYVKDNSKDLINNSYNSRQETLAQENSRGTIYAADGKTVLAETGVDTEGNEARLYPQENMYSHVVGFSTKGKTGVESQANYYLINSSIPLSGKVANDVANKKNPGDHVYTTLIPAVQEKAYDAMGMYSGAVIAMDPRTGKILAMVSKPDFDPNKIVTLWDGLVEDEESSILLNRATQGIYPPGSTFKILTALEYIRENTDTWSDYTYQCNGKITIGKDTINCYHGSSHGSVDFQESFASSCNSSFVNIGMTLDRNKFGKTLNDMLFNQDLPLKMNATKSSLVVENGISDSEMVQIAIGQGKAQITPIQLCMITSAIANGGMMMNPYVVDSVKSAQGTAVASFKGSEYGIVMSQPEAKVLTSLMQSVVEEGTGSRLKGLSYTSAGKTGSAEYHAVKEDSHAWFTGFAPAENPEIVVTVIIEGIGSGGDYAVPIAKRVFDAYFGSTVQ